MKTNEGKKYIKLRGDEIPPVDNGKRAREFMEWYAKNAERVRRCAAGIGLPVDDDLLTDTFLGIHDIILYKGARVVNFTAYFLRAYKTKRINEERKKLVAELVSLSGCSDAEEPEESEAARKYQGAVDELNDDIVEYVRWTSDAATSAIFEIYVRSYPDMSYKKISDTLGIPFAKVWLPLGKVKKNVDRLFRSRKDFLASIVNF